MAIVEDPDTGVHFQPLPPNARPIDRLEQDLRIEIFRLTRAGKATWRETKKLRETLERLGDEVANWRVYFFGLDGQGHLAKLDAEHRGLKEQVTALTARVALLEKFQVRIAAITGLVVAVVSLTIPVLLRWLAGQ